MGTWPHTIEFFTITGYANKKKAIKVHRIFKTAAHTNNHKTILADSSFETNDVIKRLKLCRRKQ